MEGRKFNDGARGDGPGNSADGIEAKPTTEPTALDNLFKDLGILGAQFECGEINCDELDSAVDEKLRKVRDYFVNLEAPQPEEDEDTVILEITPPEADLPDSSSIGEVPVSLHRTEAEEEFYGRLKRTEKLRQIDIIRLAQSHPALKDSKDVLGGHQFILGWQLEFNVYSRSQILEALELSQIDKIPWTDIFQCNDFTVIAQSIFRYKYGMPLMVIDMPFAFGKGKGHSVNGAVCRNKDGQLDILIIEPQNDEVTWLTEYAKTADMSSIRITMR